MRAALGYLAGATVTFTGGLVDLAYINFRLVPHVLEEPKPIEAPRPIEIAEVAVVVPVEEPPAEEPSLPKIVFEPAGVVRFRTGSARLDSRAKREISEVVAKLRADPALLVRAEGHADERGPSPYNQALSEQRAKAVAAELARLGIERRRIQRRGFGEERASGARWFRDRRVEISIGGPKR